MNNAIYLRLGKLIFAIAILGIGLVHVVTGNFPAGLMPVPANVPGRAILVYLTGAALMLAGLMMLIRKLAKYGIMLAGAAWLLLLVLLQIPRLIFNLHDPGPWTTTFETTGILSGVFLLAASNIADGKSPYYKLIGRYLFLSALIIFGIQHYMYLKFIATLIPVWLPFPMFWAVLVMVAFFAASISILINIKIRLTTWLLSLMFLLWVLILHIPRALSNMNSEPEWTSLFVALAMGGTSMLLASITQE
jgi:uncharacterized membrane protein